MTVPLHNFRLTDYEVFLFDLDGTLIDGSDRHFVQCVLETGKEFGCEDLVIAPGAPLRQFVRTRLPEVTEELLDQFYQKNRERMLRTPRPVKFHEDAIAFITRHQNTPRAIVTNCRNWELALTERVLDLKSLFDRIVFKTDEIAGKPAPDLYLLAAEKFQITPEKCLVFEDSSTGISSAKQAGMTVIGIDRGVHHDFEAADYVISSFHELS